jgi:hypothetical protein
MPLETHLRSNDSILNAQSQRQRELSELQRLIARKAQLEDKQDLERAIADRRREIQNIDQRILELQNQRKQELEEMTLRRRKSLPHGELLEKITEDSEGLLYNCRKHPDRMIRDWYMHVLSFSVHPEFRENNPTFRRQVQEARERDRLEAREKVEKEYDRREGEKLQLLAKNGFVKVA